MNIEKGDWERRRKGRQGERKGGKGEIESF